MSTAAVINREDIITYNREGLTPGARVELLRTDGNLTATVDRIHESRRIVYRHTDGTEATFLQHTFTATLDNDGGQIYYYRAGRGAWRFI